ncbi:MAG: glycosyltransferase family 39 protein [Deltaproteobacteria bacterium]|nr:glycosyltransferase family 39 protein [Deltaproteobacteria bacterium]
MTEAAPDRCPAPWGGRLPGRWATACDMASATVMAGVLAVVFATFRDYGITWDESWHLTYGDHILAWFATAGQDTSALCYRMDYMYGGGFDLLGAVLRRVSPLSDYETIHLLGAAVGVLGLTGVWSLARRLAGPAAGLVAVLLLASTPVYYGHMFANPKDLPFAVGYVWALDALCALVLQLPRPTRRLWIRFAVLVGLAMSVRIAGILLLVYLGAVVIVFAWLRARATGRIDVGLATFRRLGLPAAASMVGAWLVMLASWPWALLDPIRRPWMALGRMSRFSVHRRHMPFAGEDMLTTEPRWDYLPHYFGIKLPLLIVALVLAAVVIVAVVMLSRRRRQRVTLAQRNITLVLVAAIAGPPTYAILVSSVVYDGLRHFLFLVPALVVVAALTAVALPRMLPRGRAGVALGLMLVGGVGLTIQTRAMVQLHPYQYIYFNELVGGLHGAQGDYDTDYYGASYKEAFERLADHLWEHERDRFLNTRYLVSGCIPDFVAWNYIDGNFAWVEAKGPGAEFYIGYTRSNCHLRKGKFPVIATVDRSDTMLAVIRDLRSAKTDAKAKEREVAKPEPPPGFVRKREMAKKRKRLRPSSRTRRPPDEGPIPEGGPTPSKDAAHDSSSTTEGP